MTICLFVFIDNKGVAQYSQASPIKSNRHILPRKISEQNFLSNKHLTTIQTLTDDWLKKKADIKKDFNRRNILVLLTILKF